MFNEKESTEIDPAVIRDASATRNMMAMWLVERVKVLGIESATTLLIELQLKFVPTRGKSPLLITNGTWIRAWRLAPIATPTATPATPHPLPKAKMPKIIPVL